MTEMANNNNNETMMDHQPRVRQCVVLLFSLLFSSSFVFFLYAQMFPRMLHFGRKKYK